METPGGFYEVEKDGKLILAYHHPLFDPKPQTESLTSSAEATTHEHLHEVLLLCPDANLQVVINYPKRKLKSLGEYEYDRHTLKYEEEEEEDPSVYYRKVDHHPVYPLYWCNNKEFDVNGGCNICDGSNFGTHYYMCAHGKMYHQECVKTTSKINHPYHPEHSLVLAFQEHKDPIIECLCCGGRANFLVYHCSICKVYMHPICAKKPISFFIEKPKRHGHPLTFFPRQTSLTCNVCGLLRSIFSTYICARCNFVAHKDCMYAPSIIKISRHHHRISYISSLQSGQWRCGVCRQSIDNNYGAYTCERCSDYAVHSRCALRKDVWDEVDLEDVPEEDDTIQDVVPFDIIYEGVILHFLHDHHLQLKDDIPYDENNLCQACALPIFDGNVYSCMECNFILHERCANAPRTIDHALHPHPLTLSASGAYHFGAFQCSACIYGCGGWGYGCMKKKCCFDLDMRCALISEPFDYEGHKHPLFLALDPREKVTCQVCISKDHQKLNCIECDFIICFKCATLPYKAMYKHDKHFLTLSWGKEVSENDWCEMCERNLKDTRTNSFYWCKDCCTTLHIECLFGKDPYLKLGCYINFHGTDIEILGRSNTSRPFCDSCENRCHGKRFMIGDYIACSGYCCGEFV